MLDDEYKPLRKPRISLTDDGETALKDHVILTSTPPKKYSFKDLLRMALSPYSIANPQDWERIEKEHPLIVSNRKVSSRNSITSTGL